MVIVKLFVLHKYTIKMREIEFIKYNIIYIKYIIHIKYLKYMYYPNIPYFIQHNI